VITRFKVAPFIATLGMLYIARGFAGLRNNGYTFPNLIGKPEFGNTGFERLGAGNFLGISYSIWIMVVFALVAFFVTTRVPFGRHVYALGGNRRAAELSGVRTKQTETIVYMISGFCAAMVGLIIASQLVAAHPATGTGFELTAIAAVVLGGTSLSGGRGSIGGTIIGAFVIGVLSDGLVILGFSTFLQNVIKGLVIIAAVVIDQMQIRLEERIALQRQK
jgi:ribose/xylose/arabinose/galactoside ABC-type transport system permease subunit